MTEIVDKKLDNETRKLLAETGMLGFTENPEFLYVPKAFRESEKIKKEFWPIFKLIGKNGIESAKMEDGMGHMEYDDKNDVRRWIGKSGSSRIGILSDGIKGWKTFYDKDGELIPFRENNGKISTHSLERVPVALAIELSNAILDRTSLTQEELLGLEF